MSSIQADLFRYTGKQHSIGLLLKCFFAHPGFRFTVILRMCQRYPRFHPIGCLCRVYFYRLKIKFGLQIPFTSKIGKGLFIGHFGNIVVNQGAEIGTNCNIAQGVTIGFVNRGERRGCPKIGNRVWIGANSVVVGNIKVGDDVLIAPLSFVNFDVANNAVVAGNPAKIVSYNGSREYVNRVIT